MRLSSLGRAARSKAGLKVRQPISVMNVKVREAGEFDLFRSAVGPVMDELNVKELEGNVTFSEDTASQWFDYHIKPKLELLGPKYGSGVEAITRGLEALVADDSWEAERALSKGHTIQVAGHELLPEEVEVIESDKPGWASASDGGYVVRLYTKVSPELELEGTARELVHRIQNMRRSAGFEISDRVVTYYRGGPELERVIDAHRDYIAQETLSLELSTADPPSDAHTETHNLDGIETTLAVRRSG